MLLTKTKATYDDLMQAEGKAELIDGEIVRFMSTRGDAGFAGDEIFSWLREYSRRTRWGRAIGDNKGFKVNLPRRQSFSPDAAFYVGPNPGKKFYEGAPLFAVEVRSKNDYGATAEEIKMATKRDEYFLAGTKVVWDIDVLGEIVVRKYTAEAPDTPTEFRRGEVADAEPALPDWTIPVDALFDE